MLDLDSLEAKARAVDQGVLLFDGAKLYADTTLSLIRELREARAWIAMVHEWFGRESSIIYELSESIRVDIAQAAAAEREACADLVQGWNTAMTDKLATAIRARGAKGGE